MKFSISRLLRAFKEHLTNSRMSVPGVFRRKEDVIGYLSQPEYSNLEPVKALLSLNAESHNFEAKHAGTRKFPFIVFEGLDGAGKSRLSRETAKCLSAVQTSTPPDALIRSRPFFDGHSDKILRRAFYSLGNYMAESRVTALLSERPVVMDRFWHSTAASAIGDVDAESYPSDENESWFWPVDLIRPDFVFFLDVSEATRLQRMSRRKNFSEDEEKIKSNAPYRLKLTETFKKMRDPGVIVINCEPIPKVVLRDVLSHIKTNPTFVSLIA